MRLSGGACSARCTLAPARARGRAACRPLPGPRVGRASTWLQPARAAAHPLRAGPALAAVRTCAGSHGDVVRHRTRALAGTSDISSVTQITRRVRARAADAARDDAGRHPGGGAGGRVRAGGRRAAPGQRRVRGRARRRGVGGRARRAGAPPGRRRCAAGRGRRRPGPRADHAHAAHRRRRAPGPHAARGPRGDRASRAAWTELCSAAHLRKGPAQQRRCAASRARRALPPAGPVGRHATRASECMRTRAQTCRSPPAQARS